MPQRQYNSSLNPQQKEVLATFIRQQAASHSDDFNCGYVTGFAGAVYDYYAMSFPRDSAQSSEYKEAWARGYHEASQLVEEHENE